MNLLNRLFFPPSVSSWCRKASLRPSNISKNSSQLTSSRLGSFSPKSMRRMPPSSSALLTLDGRPPRASTHLRMALWSVVVLASLIWGLPGLSIWNEGKTSAGGLRSGRISRLSRTGTGRPQICLLRRGQSPSLERTRLFRHTVAGTVGAVPRGASLPRHAEPAGTRRAVAGEMGRARAAGRGLAGRACAGAHDLHALHAAGRAAGCTWRLARLLSQMGRHHLEADRTRDART